VRSPGRRRIGSTGIRFEEPRCPRQVTSTALSSNGPGSQRPPDSLPYPDRAAGTVNEQMPFDHIVVVMMENHSFDNVLGALSRSGQAAADGLSFDGSPPNGTIFDRLDAHGISWHDYFTDLPGTVVIPAIIGKHLTHLRTRRR
jgi:phosphoesterase family protein